MKTKTVVLMAALLAVIWTCGRGSVKAANPPAAASDAAGTAAVRGKIKYEGKLPKQAAINMAADPSCSKQHPSPVASPDVVADSQGELENVIVFVADGLGDRTFNPPTQPVVIQQKGCMYEPHVLAVRANQPFEVVNEDPTSHNIHAIPANNREWNKAEPPGAKIDEAFAREEIAIPVKCNVHPWMHSYVAVFKHPFFAVTGKDGSFNLNDLPPGTYTIEAWHEKLGVAKQTIKISPNETKSLDFVFKPKPGM